MKVYGLNEQELWDALEEAGALFENNLQFTREPDLISRRNSVYRLTLRVGDSSGPGARRAASGRRTVAANYAAHYAFMAMVFVHNPEARIITALQTYEGHRDFLDKAPDVAHRNVGSMMRPAAFGVRTAKLRALTKPEGRGS